MKKFILCLVLAFIGIVTNAEVKREGDTFKVEQTVKEKDTVTKYTWIDKDGISYPVFITKKGSCYVIRTSKKSGKEYKYYLPKSVQEIINKEINN